MSAVFTLSYRTRNAINKRGDVSPRRLRPVIVVAPWRHSIGSAINNMRVFLKTIFPAIVVSLNKIEEPIASTSPGGHEPLLRSPLRISDDRGGRGQLETLAHLVECGPVLLNAINTSVAVTGTR